MSSRLKLSPLRYVGPTLGSFTINSFGFRGLRLSLTPMADGRLENILKPQDVTIDPVSGSKLTSPLVSINASGLNGGPAFAWDSAVTGLMEPSDITVIFGSRGIGFATNINVLSENDITCNAPLSNSSGGVVVYVCTKNGYGTTTFTYT